MCRVILLLTLLVAVQGQNNLCIFQESPAGYTCNFMRGLFINQTDDFIILTTPHLPPRTDNDVTILRTSSDVGIESTLNIIPRGIFQRFPNLRIVNLHDAEVKSVSFGLQDCTNLETLILNDNLIQNITTGAFSNCNNLKEISIESNLLSGVYEDSFMNLPHLEIIRLKNNSISVIIPGTFNLPSGLQTLDLQSNYIAKIYNETFSELTSLTSINLSDNKISEIESYAFYNLENLISLDLSYNELAKLASYSFSNLTSLDTLNIRNNNITAIDRRFLSGLSGLQSILATGNLCVDSDASRRSGEDFLNVFNQCFANFDGTITTSTPDAGSIEKSKLSVVLSLVVLVLFLTKS